MSQKRIILSDSSLNCYGYRVLTSGMSIEAFKKNPIMLYMHSAMKVHPIGGTTKLSAIGRIYNLTVTNFLPFLFLTKLMIYQKKLPQNTKQGLSMPQVWVLKS